MAKLPVVSGQQMFKILNKIGFRFAHQTGSHVTLVRLRGNRNEYVTLPLHREIKRGTLLAVMKDAGLSRDDLARLLD